jgi:uncharacterized FlaG/YvyC family protein
MSIHVPPAGPQDAAALAAVQPRRRTADVTATATPAPHPEVAQAATADTMPSRPPVDVLKEMEAASQRYEDLRSQQRELHFSHDPQQNRVIVEVRDLDGNVLRTIPPSRALDVIAGGPLD